MHPLPLDDKGNTRILVMIDTYCRVHLPALLSIQCPAFRNEHSFATAYSKEENGLVELANQEIMHHLCTMLFDKWSYEQLPMVQRIMNFHQGHSSTTRYVCRIESYHHLSELFPDLGESV